MGRRLVATGLAVGLAVGGYVAAERFMPNLGLPEIHNPFDTGPSDVEIPGMRVTDQQLTGRVGAVVLGQATISVESKPSTLTFRDGNVLDVNLPHRIVGDGDATLVWQGIATVNALPCLRVSTDFAQPVSDSPSAANDATTPLSYTIQLGEGGRVTSLQVNRGALDLCAPKITNTEEMTSRPDGVTEDGWLGSRVGEAERKTFVDTMVTITEAVALADSCPSSLIPSTEIDRQAARIVLGDIAMRTDIPQSIRDQVIALNHKGHQIVVTSASDGVRAEHYRRKLVMVLDAAERTTTTDPRYDDGHTHPLEMKVNKAGFAVRGCTANTPITLAAQ